MVQRFLLAALIVYKLCRELVAKQQGSRFADKHPETLALP